METTPLTIDGVYEWVSEGRACVQERILWIDDCTDTAFLIEVNHPKAQVHLIECTSIDQGIKDGSIRPIADPYENLCITDDAYSAARIKERDKNWAAMSLLLDACPEIRFDRRLRGELINQISTRHKSDPRYVSRKHAYRLWRRFCQRGQVANALLGDHHKSGWKAAQRERKPATEKLGRDRSGDTRDQRRQGFVVTPKDENILHQIGVLFYKTRDKVSKRKRSWRNALEVGCRHFYKKGWKLVGGKRVEDMPPASCLPTLRQLKRAFYAKENPVGTLKKREGERAYNLRHRALHGDQREISFAPMQIVQMDAQTAKIFLVHCVTRLLLGRPTIVMARCVMSRLIVAFSVTYEYESWAAYRLAMINMVTDKVEYCKGLGIEITEHDWPAHHLCSAIGTDNGPMISRYATQFREAFGISLFHAGPGRPDMKPVIESGFADLNRELVFDLPGAILTESSDPDADPITKNYKENASLDIHEFEQALAHYCIAYNRRVLENYPLTDDMKGGVVNPIPIDLWNWGIRHRSGSFRPANPDIVRLHCLTRDRAKVTPEGIKFKNRYYQCDRSLSEQWQERARANGEWWIDVVYGSNDMGTIFLNRGKLRKPEDPYLEPCKPKRLFGERECISLTELLSDQHEHQMLVRKLNEHRPQKQADYQSNITKIVQGGKRKTQEKLHGDRQETDELRTRRALAIAEERERAGASRSSVPEAQPRPLSNEAVTTDSGNEFPFVANADYELIQKALSRR